MMTDENNKKMLVDAVKRNDILMVKKMILSGYDVNTLNIFHDSLLFIACENGNFEMAFFLLHHQANIHLLNKGNQSALLAACKGGNVEIVKLLVQQGIAVKKIPGLKQRLPISLAFSYFRVDVIQFFIDNDLLDLDDFKDINYYKFQSNNVNAMKILDIVFSNKKFCDPDFIKSEFKKLIRSEANDCIDYMLNKFPFLKEHLEEYLEDINVCFGHAEEEGRFNCYSNSNLNPILQKHLYEGSYGVFENKMLIHFMKHGLAKEAQDPYGQTILHYSAMEYIDEYDNFSPLQALLYLGYNIDTRNAHLQTPLHSAIENGLFYHALYLIYKGANVNAFDKNNKTVLAYAECFVSMGLENDDEHNIELKKDLVQLLKDYGATYYPS